MSSGRHRRDSAPDEQPWPEQERPAWPEPIRYDLPPRYDDEQPRRRAADETSFDLPAWDDQGRPGRGRPEQPAGRWAPDETSVDLPRQALDETSVDLPRPSARDTSVALPRQSADETSFDLPAWDDGQEFHRLPPRRPAVDETVLDLPAWDERSPRARARA